MSLHRWFRYTAVVGLCLAGSALVAIPAGQAAQPDQTGISAPEAEVPPPLDPIPDGNPGANPAPIGEATDIVGPLYIHTGTYPNPCLNAKGGGTINHTPIILYGCHQTLNNQWYFVRPTGASYWYIRTAGAGHRCLNAKGGGTANYTPIILYDCHPTANNVWYVRFPSGSRYFYIRTAGAGNRCLNVKGGGTASLTPIILYDCHATWNNLWYDTPA